MQEKDTPTLYKSVQAVYPNLEKQLNSSHADREWRRHSHLEPVLLRSDTKDEVRVLDTKTYWNRVLSLNIDGSLDFPI